MQVIHVVRQFYPAIGGLENFVFSLAQAQQQQGLTVKVITLNRLFYQPMQPLPQTEIIAGIHVQRLPYHGSYKYPIAPSVVRYLSQADLVHVHGVDFFCDFLALTQPLHQKPMVLSTHGGFFHTAYANRAKLLFFHTITRLSLKAYLRVFACSHNDYQRFATLCRPRLSLIENGVDTQKFAKASSITATQTMAFIGRFSDNKRIDLLVQMMAELHALEPQAKLLILGKDWDNNYVQLRQQVQQHQLKSIITFQLEPTDKQIRAELAQCSYIISASEYEGFGLSLIEGMAAGLLPLASDIPSFRHIVQQAQLGALVDFSQPQLAAKRIAATFQENEKNYPQWRQQAITHAQNYAWPKVAKVFIRAYQQLHQGRRTIQGVQIDGRDGRTIITQLDNALQQHTPLVVAYANAHTINLARANSAYRRTLNHCLVLNDGFGVTLASRWKYGQGFSENLNGTDFTPRFLRNSQQPLAIFLLGAKPNSVQRCFERWQQQYPQHQWVGYHHGYFEDDQALCQHIKASGANLLLVAMGNPKQEQWLSQHLEATGAIVGIGVGALFDFTAGNVPRAPHWLRQLRFEWLYRLLKEPKRLWRRYLVGNVRFLYHALGDQS
ncbi:MAG: WecB/TagA/CpsF family glycosyltransferase [Ferrimonas sp.]